MDNRGIISLKEHLQEIADARTNLIRNALLDMGWKINRNTPNGRELWSNKINTKEGETTVAMYMEDAWSMQIWLSSNSINETLIAELLR